MRILHAFSNWKWTGPAEPAVRLAEAEAAAGHEVTFACGRCPYPDLENLVEQAARRAGLDVVAGLNLRKHLDLLGSGRDLSRLTRLARERRFDVVHTHLLNDHLLAGAAARRAGREARIVRTIYGPADLRARLRTRLVLSRLTDGVIAASEAAAAAVRERAPALAPRTFVVPGAVDVERFGRERLEPLRAAARAEFGFGPDDVVGAIVARVQRHRRFELLLEAFAAAAREEPRLRLLAIGRGTFVGELLLEPLRALGLGARAVHAGYREGAAYEAALAAADFGIFLVPGSDGSCRAARELAAAGLPLVVTRRPPLPEIAGTGPDAIGFALEEQPAALAAAFRRLAADGAERARLAAAARARARAEFALDVQAAAVLGVYARLEVAVRGSGP